MTKCRTAFVSSLCFFSLITIVDAQAPATAPTVATDYSQEAFVVQDDSSEIAFENDGTSVRSSMARVKIQSDAGIQRYAVLTFAYQSSSEAVEMDYVRVRKPDASVVVTPPDSVQDLASAMTQQAPMYVDVREKHVAVKGLGKGDVLEYQAHWRTTKALAPGEFWLSYNFSHDVIDLRQNLQISIPKERTLKWRSPKLQPVITESAGRRIFLWTGSQLEHKSKEQEEKEQGALALQAARGRMPQAEIEVSSFASWEALGRWYNSLQQDRIQPTPEVRAKATELTKGLSDERAKASAIYDYVATQIHYIGISFGIGRYQPHAAGEVLANQYGDCKDKHTLLAALLQAAGIQAYPALIASQLELDSEVPSPAQFDHVISAIQLGGQLVWVDTTPEVAPFGYILSPLRGKKTLLIYADRPAALTTTPDDPSRKSLQEFHINAKLSDTGTLEGKIEQQFQGGDTEVVLRSAFRSVPLPQWKDLVQQLSFASNFAGDVSDVTASAPEKTAEPFRFSYSYSRKDYPDWSNHRVSTPLPPFGLPAAEEKERKPVNPIWLGQPSVFQFESHIELPKGYRPILPKSLSLTEGFASYERSYAFKDGILTAQRRLVVIRSEVAVAELEAYKKFSKRVAEDYGFTILLSSGPSSPFFYQSEIWELPMSENAEAARAYDEAREKFNKQDAQGEISALKRALDVDPKFTRAWLWLGEIYTSTQQRDQAIAAYTKALDLDPDEPVCYKALGFALLISGKFEESAAVWRKMMKALPTDSSGAEMVGASMMSLKRYAEAEAALDIAISLDPDSSVDRFQLGSASLHAGHGQKAVLAYRKAVELNPTPEMLNNIAYELAIAKGDLTVALDYAKRAVAEETSASHQVKIGELKVEDLQPTRALASYWDTLGWVYFQSGDTTAAEKYLNASWMLGQNGTVADHLGEVYEREGKKEDAIRMFKFSLACSKESKLKEATRDRLARLAPASRSESDFAAASELSNMRMRKLPRIVEGEETADFFLTFVRDPRSSVATIEEVKFISGSEKLKSADKIVKSADFRYPLPPEGSPRLLRRGILSCYPSSGCSLTLLNPDDVRSVN